MTAFVMTFVVLSANVLGASMAYPQASRLVRTRRTDGLSSVWVGVSLTMNAWWLAYGIGADVWPLVPVSIVSLVLYGTIAVVMVSALGRSSLPGLVGGFAGLGVVPLAALLIGGWPVAAVVIGVGYGAQLAPAVIAAYRTDRLSGVAPGTWVLALAEAGLWLFYGAHVEDLALLVGGLAGVVMASAILGRLVATRQWLRQPAWEPA